MKFNPNSENLTPKETALIKAAEEMNLTLRSRAHFLAALDAVDLSKESVDSKMGYVLGLMSLGFSASRARSRLGLSKTAVVNWRKSNEDHSTRYLEAKSRGELMLEETVLLAAERDPEWAYKVLVGRDKEEDEIESKESDTFDASIFLNKPEIKDALE
jgi:hypothetical protein